MFLPDRVIHVQFTDWQPNGDFTIPTPDVLHEDLSVLGRLSSA